MFLWSGDGGGIGGSGDRYGDVRMEIMVMMGMLV